MSTSPRGPVGLLTEYDAESAYNLAYQALFTTIRLNWDNQPGQPHSILLATPTAYDGKTICLANVAIVAAQNGCPTILVDTNAHSATLQQYFGLSEHPGLSDLLLMEDSISPQRIASYLQQTSVPGLALLSGGSKIQSAADRNRQLSFKLARIVDGLGQLLKGNENLPGLILFDSLPILSGNDAALISTFVDQTFLLVVTGHTTRAQAKKAYNQLERVHAKVAGLIMLNAS